VKEHPWDKRNHATEHVTTTNPTLTDQQLIEALLKCDRLSEREEKAFTDMQGQMQIRRKPLTSPQRQWADAVYDRLELEADRTINMVSTGQALRGNVPTFDWEKSLPKKPPGRK